jgi:hypothetical protein
MVRVPTEVKGKLAEHDPIPKEMPIFLPKQFLSYLLMEIQLEIDMDEIKRFWTHEKGLIFLGLMLHMMAFMSLWLCMGTVPSSPQLAKKSLAYLCPCHYGIPDQRGFLDFFFVRWRKPTNPLGGWL